MSDNDALLNLLGENVRVKLIAESSTWNDKDRLKLIKAVA